MKWGKTWHLHLPCLLQLIDLPGPRWGWSSHIQALSVKRPHNSVSDLNSLCSSFIAWQWVGKSGSSFLDYLQFRREGQKVQFCIRWKLNLPTDFNKVDGLILFEHLWLLWGVNELANVKVLAHINVIQVLAMIIVIIAIIIFNWLDYKRLWLVFSSFQHGSLLLTES